MSGMKLLQALLMLVICGRVGLSIMIRGKYGTESFSKTFDKDVFVNQNVELDLEVVVHS